MNTQLNQFNALLKRSGKTCEVNDNIITGIFKEIDDKFNSIDTKYFYAKEDLKQGDIIQCNNFNYMIMTKNESINNAYYIYTVRKCPYTINLPISNNAVINFPAIMQTKALGVTSGGEINLVDGNVLIMVQNNNATKQIKINDTLIKFNSAYKIIGVDRTMEGLIVLHCEVTDILSGDDMINEISNSCHKYAPVINANNISIAMGQTANINATVSENGNAVSGSVLTYKSDNLDIIVDSTGLVKGNGECTGNIAISYIGLDNKTYTDTITVSIEDIYVLTVPTSISMDTKTSKQIITTVTKNNVIIENPTLIYSSSNPSIAIVDYTGLITPKDAGTCIITVSYTTPNGKVQKQEISVAVAQAHNYILNVSPTSVSIVKGNTSQITAMVEDNETAISNATFTYNSNNVSIATVSSTGIITAVEVGNANIAVSYVGADNITYTKTVATTVTQPVQVQKNIKISPSYNESGDYKLLEGDTQAFTVFAYTDTTKTTDTFTITVSKFTDGSNGNVIINNGNYTFNATDNGFSITNNETVLNGNTVTIQCMDNIDSSVTKDFDILLGGVF